MNKITPIILSGGNGTRLFPISKIKCPKQFINVFDDKTTMFSSTIKRFDDNKYFNNPMIIGNINHIDLFKKEILNNINLFNNDNIKIFLEPKPMNTAGAICSVIEYLYNNNKKDDIVIFISSDAYIKEIDLFKTYILEGQEEAKKDKLVIFGVKPLYPEVGYGYINIANNIKKNLYVVNKFTEKPDIEKAKFFLESNQYLWNVGIFMSKVKTLYNLFSLYQSKMLNDINDIIKNSSIEVENFHNIFLEKIVLNSDLYNNLDKISIDYAIIEKLSKNNLSVVSMDLIWSDLGSYKALYDNDSCKDENKNVIKGENNVVINNVKNCYINNTNNKSIICCSDIENIVIVQSDNILLIMDKNKSQNIKKIVNEIENKYGDKFL